MTAESDNKFFEVKKILVVGSGGREQAIAEAVTVYSGYGSVKKVLIAPGNAGTEFLQRREGLEISNVDLPHDDVGDIVDIVRKHEIDMVVVGPEAWLEKEIGDILKKEGIPAIAPEKDRAILEFDKVHTRLKGWEWGIPQPEFAYFSDVMEAIGFVKGHDLQEGVVKVRGLAAGKGVAVCSTQNEIIEAVISAKSKFGSAADQILIEERLYGQEVSYIGVCDGETFLPFTPAMDFKFLNGKTTGGMATIAPNPYVNSWMAKNIMAKIVKPVVQGMKSEGRPYKGILYFGIMLTKDGPKLIEINARHGDPETQVQLPLLKHYLNDIYHLAITGNLAVYSYGGINYHPGECAAALVVLAAEGYPDRVKKGEVIYGLNKNLPEKTTIYHAGTKEVDGKIITNGGRVLGITTSFKDLTETVRGDLLKRAIERAYSVIGKENEGVGFKGMQYIEDLKKPELLQKVDDAYANAGVSYTPVDHLKRMAIEFARTTEDVASYFGFSVLPESRGESAFLVGMNGFIGAFVQEGLGTKNLIISTINKGDKAPGRIRESWAGDENDKPTSDWESIAWSAAACVANDIAAVGAQPVVLCPHWAAGSSEFFKDVKRNTALYVGWLKACNHIGAVYGPGETSILNGIVYPDTIEMSGSGFGVIMPPSIKTLGENLEVGDHLVAVKSNGIHDNGLSYARKIAREILPNGYDEILPSGITFGQALLKPSHMYSPLTRELFEEGANIKYMVNVTGHGLRKTMRAKKDFTYTIQMPTIPEEFKFMQEAASLSNWSALSMWNMGLGYLLMVPKSEVGGVIKVSKGIGLEAMDVGVVEPGPKRVIVELDKERVIFNENDMQFR